MISREALAIAVTAAPALAVVLILLAPRRFVAPVAQLAAFPVAALAATLAVQALRSPGAPVVGDWLVVDVAGGLLVGVIGVVGLASVLVSQSYLDHARTSLVSPERGDRVYYAVLYAFWAISRRRWRAISARRGSSSRRRPRPRRSSSASAGRGGRWRRVSTRPHLARPRRGAARDRPHRGRCAGGRARRALVAGASGPCELDVALVAYLLLLAGMAAKIGWAPVHNWLPDAHRAAPPVSAFPRPLLPAVPLVAWRSEQALAPVIGARTAESVLVAFGLASSRWRSPSSGGRCPGSGCSPTRASSTWA